MKSRYSDELVGRIPRAADKVPIAEMVERHGVSGQSLYSWRKHVGDMGSNKAKRLKALAQENVHLKKLMTKRAQRFAVLGSPGQRQRLEQQD